MDLAELPPAPEEPMQLAATWEFMGMAEGHGHSATSTSAERGMELDTSTASSADDTGSPHEEVALASAWDFVPQWQPGAPAGSGEASPPPSAPVAEKAAPSAPLSTDAPVNPVTTAKYGIGTAEPASPSPFDDAPAAPEAKGEPGWDQMFPPEQPASPAAAKAPKAPAAPAAEPEADPFTEFASEAARKRDDEGSRGGSST
jgi:hypothetical protein